MGVRGFSHPKCHPCVR